MNIVHCRFCNIEYVHIEQVVVNKEAKTVQLQAHCENGHHWIHQFTAHEGQLEIDIIELPELDFEEEPPKDFWE